jgi:hypothetical protein
LTASSACGQNDERQWNELVHHAPLATRRASNLRPVHQALSQAKSGDATAKIGDYDSVLNLDLSGRSPLPRA